MKSIFIIGPSGSGKSTLSQHLNNIYKSVFPQNSVLLINLDPANPTPQQNKIYDVDLNNLITIQEIMQQFQIGPNGAMIYAMQFLQQNKQWLISSIKKKIIQKQPYFKIKFSQLKEQNKQQQNKFDRQCQYGFTLIFDLPGQVQLYLHNQSLKTIITQISLNLKCEQILLQLFDSTYIYNVNDFISLCMMSLVSMINFSMPHINVLNKIDVIKGQRPALGMLNDYLDICSMKAIVEDLQQPISISISNNNKQIQKKSIIRQLSQILDQYNQVSYIPCSVYKQDLIKYLILQIETTFGYHQINKATNSKYNEFIKNIDRPMIKQQLITQLENQLFRQNQQQQQQQINKFINQLNKDKIKQK